MPFPSTSEQSSHLLSAVKACLTRLGACLSARQLVACIVMSLPYKPCTRHGKKPHSCSFELTSLSNCHPELLRSLFRIASSEKSKVRINVDDLSDGLAIFAIASELCAEDRTADTPQIDLSANRILGKRFFDNRSDGIRDHPS